jgi:hypothetical protein
MAGSQGGLEGSEVATRERGHQGVGRGSVFHSASARGLGGGV